MHGTRENLHGCMVGGVRVEEGMIEEVRMMYKDIAER